MTALMRFFLRRKVDGPSAAIGERASAIVLIGLRLLRAAAARR